MNLPISPADFPSLTEKQFTYAIQSVLPDFSRLSFKAQAEQMGIGVQALSAWRQHPDIRKAQQIARRELYKTMINDAVRATVEIVNDPGHRDRLKAAELIFNLTGEMREDQQNSIGQAIQINIVNVQEEKK